MKLKDVVIGETYIARVSGTRVKVKIDADLGEDYRLGSGKSYHRGWTVTNLATKRTVRIRSAQRLTRLCRRCEKREATFILPVGEGEYVCGPCFEELRQKPAALAPSVVPELDAAVRQLKAAGAPQAPNAVGFMARIPGSCYYRPPPAGTPADVPSEVLMRRVLDGARADLRALDLVRKRESKTSVTNAEAAEARLCMDCGEPGAPAYLLQLPVPRIVRVCARCLPGWAEWTKGSLEFRDGEYKGVRYTVGPRHPFPGIGWKIPTHDHLGRSTGYHESQGAFYDGVPEHPEGAYAWAEAAVRKHIDGLDSAAAPTAPLDAAGVRFLSRKYGLTDDEAQRLATHPKSSAIQEEVLAWCVKYGMNLDSAPARGVLLERLAPASLGAAEGGEG